jgi:hypothetical protein
MERCGFPSTSTSSESLPSLVVWDFDLTLLSIHSWGARIHPSDVAHRSLEQDIADLEFFRAFVKRALAKGVQVSF